MFPHMRERGPGGVESSEEVDLHGTLEGFDGLGFDGADFDDAGVVDEDVNATEAGDGFGDEALTLGWLGKIGGDEVKVFRSEMGVGCKLCGLGLLQFFAFAGGKDQLYGLSGKAVGDGEAEAARSTGDEDDSTIRYWRGFQNSKAGNGSGGQARGAGSEVKRIERSAHRVGWMLSRVEKQILSRMTERKAKAKAALVVPRSFLRRLKGSMLLVDGNEA